MTFKIKTSANFEAAHRLSNYDGKCNQLHGHNFKVEVKASSEKLDKQEMVFDFKELKIILNEFDHKTLLKENDDNKKIAESIPSDWIVWLKFEPTAESLAKDICEKIYSKFNLTELKITVHENDISSASFKK